MSGSGKSQTGTPDKQICFKVTIKPEDMRMKKTGAGRMEKANSQDMDRTGCSTDRDSAWS